jgi:hypothetical protein
VVELRDRRTGDCRDIALAEAVETVLTAIRE